MFNLVFTEQYGEDLAELVGYPYWSLHVGDYRVIYKIDNQSKIVEILTILARKHDYKELGKL